MAEDAEEQINDPYTLVCEIEALIKKTKIILTVLFLNGKACLFQSIGFVD